jgi:DNA modification methylase
MKKTRDRVKELIRVKASELRASASNWRLHGDQQKAAMRGILDEVGFVSGLIAFRDKRGKLTLIDGHLRKEISGDELVPVQVVDLTEAEAKKILATFDPIGAMATSNAEALESLLAGVKTDSEGVAAMLAELMAQANAAKPTPLVHEDEVPEPPKVAITKPGDLWQLGAHRLLCGDSTKAEDVERLLGNRKPFIMVTDPPYGVEYDSDWRLEAGVNKPWQKLASGKVQNDDRVDWSESYKLFPGHVAYVWHAGRFAADLVVNLRAAAFEVRTQIIWSKPSLVMSRGHYHWQHEPCWYAVRKGGSAKWCGDRKQSTLWQIANMHRTQGSVDDGKTIHSTQKPVECMARPIRNHGDKDDDVYDPFLGSGTTMIAAEQLGRRCFAMELDPIYVDVAVARWERLTGKKAKRITAEAKPPRRGRT